ncbi:MAG: 3',5'-cyclic-nucleotide phosphodiesterase [Bdellovibrionales bacterium]|nr:3',5'-cyclic-nucleotide phosphodiesterase [Bdellovibrionales bacterium]
MKFRVLGCSGSELDRSHPCSFMVGESILVDMGSGASRLTLEEQLRIKHIFLSHAHLDHTKDLAFFAENVFALRKHPVTIHASTNTLQVLKDHLFNGMLWPDFTKIPSESNPVMVFKEFNPGENITIASVTVTSVSVNHPGGCEALFFASPSGDVLYSGDTGPTTKVWDEVNHRGSKITSILLECSFPNRLDNVAHESGHLTPTLFHQEIKKIISSDIAIYAYHLKAPYRDEIIKELDDLHDQRVRVLEAGMKLDF